MGTRSVPDAMVRVSEDAVLAWARLGIGGTSAVERNRVERNRVELHSVELYMVELPFRQAVHTARGVHDRRPVVMVRINGVAVGDGEARHPVAGWGECAALADTTYDSEDAAGAFRTLEHLLAPALVDTVMAGVVATNTATAGGNRLPAPSELGPIRTAAPSSPLAVAALEMAVADCYLRAIGQSFASLLGVSDRAVPIGAVVGRTDGTDELVTRVAALVDRGYTRVKLKIAPGWDREPLAAVTQAFPDLIVQVDANESYTEDDAAALQALDRFALACIEQPFGRADIAAHVRLAARSNTPICLDESLGSPDQVAAALATEACSVVCVKPARLGGLGAALDVVRACVATGAPLWMGGMFESGFARGVNATVAAMPGFAWPGDLSPARDYLIDDLVGVPRLVRLPPDGALGVLLPDGPGMGPPPDDNALARLTTKHRRVAVPNR